MNESELAELLRRGENEELAVCENLHEEDLVRHVCAMTNTKGGTLVIGVRKLKRPLLDGTWFDIRGIAKLRNIEGRLLEVGKSLTPPVELDHLFVDLSGRSNAWCVLVTVQKRISSEQVKTKDGIAYQRLKDESVPAGNAHVNLTKPQQELLKFLDELDDTEKHDIEAKVHAKFPQSKGHGFRSMILEADWASYIYELVGDMPAPLDSLLVSDVNRYTDPKSRPSATTNPKTNVVVEQILTEFESLTEPLQISFARTQLSQQTLSSDWKEGFRHLVTECKQADRLNSMFRSLQAFKESGGRLLGSKAEYRREAIETEECLGIEIYIRVLERFFSRTADDVCFGLFGHWGRGKTHLMRRVGERLVNNHNYQVVRFSAWKYRTNPELWIHLYQTIATSMRNGDWFVRLFVPFRAGLSKYGIWPIVVVFLLHALALLPVDEKYWFAKYLLQLLGFGGILYLFFLYLRVQRLELGLSAYLHVKDYSNRLGLQAAIGDDLKALLLGWMPKYQWLPRPLIDTSDCKATMHAWWSTARKISWIGLSAYLCLTIWTFFLLRPDNASTLTLPLIGQIDASIPTWLTNLIQYLWIVAAIAFPIAALTMAKGPSKLLLVVDDLDRCPTTQTLDIIESIMLLLDDHDVRARLQIVVLAEEEAIRHAVREKYKYCWENLKSAALTGSVSNRVVQENMDKLFLAHLRLGPLNTAEIVEIAERFTNRSSTDVVSAPDDDRQVVQKEDLPVDSLAQELFTTDQSFVQEEANPTSVPEVQELQLTELEKDAIVCHLQDHATKKGSRLSPRSIRCLINKYLFARELLLEINRFNIADPAELVQALLRDEETLADSQSTPMIEMTEYKGIDYVARQVK